MDPIVKPGDVLELVRGHVGWRSTCLNLVAAETRMSGTVRGFLSCDLAQRYADYSGRDLAAHKYQGVKFIEELERMAVSLAQTLFDARYVELRPTSGHVAGNAVIMALTAPGDVVFEMGSDAGAHRLATKLTTSSLVQLDVRFLPFNAANYNVDVTAATEVIRAAKPKLVILGTSNMLFPQPVAQLAPVVHETPGAVLAFDASHVMGLLAARRFQDPLREGADLVFGSTHKTLPAPNGGVIFTNSEALIQRVSNVVYPGLVSNHHPARLPGLAVALLEMQRFGAAYADQIIANARALGVTLTQLEIPIIGAAQGFTCSHTLVAQAKEFGGSAQAAARLEECNIIVTRTSLPKALGEQGIRFGLQELTRLGATETDMPAVARLIAVALRQQAPRQEIVDQVGALSRHFQEVHFCFSQMEDSGHGSTAVS